MSRFRRLIAGEMLSNPVRSPNLTSLGWISESEKTFARIVLSRCGAYNWRHPVSTENQFMSRRCQQKLNSTLGFGIFVKVI